MTPKTSTAEPERKVETGAEGTAAAEWVATTSLVPWEKNPRKNDHAVPKVVASIRAHGFGAPIVARRSDRRVVAGHTRLKAALELGLATVPVRWMDLDDAQYETLVIADNRTGEDAEWDFERLSGLLRTMDAERLPLTGFEPHELAPLTSAEWKPPAPGAAPLNPSPYRVELREAEREVFERALAKARASNEAGCASPATEIRAGAFVAELARRYLA